MSILKDAADFIVGIIREAFEGDEGELDDAYGFPPKESEEKTSN